MFQFLEPVVARFSAWMAADPQHSELWLAVGFALAIATISLLTFEQIKARTAEQN